MGVPETGEKWDLSAAQWQRVTKALSLAAASDNLLFAGTTVTVELPVGPERNYLLRALQLLGARVACADGHCVEAACQESESVQVGSGKNSAAGRRNSTARRVIFVAANAADYPAGSRETVVGLDGSVNAARARSSQDKRGTQARENAVSAAARISWAESEMRALAAGLSQLAAEHDVQGIRLLVSLVLEPKTAAFARGLADAGFSVAVFSACGETDPEVAAELASTTAVRVFAPQQLVPAAVAETDRANAAAALGTRPQLLIDDGSHLLRLAHTTFPEVLDSLWGAAEETTSGVRPVIEMQEKEQLRVPIVAVNDVRTKTLFDNRIGTGESCVFALYDVMTAAPTNVVVQQLRQGANWLVLGFGPVGEGVCRAARALGANVIVSEPEPLRALQAVHEGYRVCDAADAVQTADVVISATGVWHTITLEMLQRMRPETVCAVAGGIDEEIALAEAAAAGWRLSQVEGADIEPAKLARLLRASGEPGPLIAASGAGINYTIGEGNPVEIMDLSFATQVAALRFLLAGHEIGQLRPQLYQLGVADENWIAKAALTARGISLPAHATDTRAGGARQNWRIHRYQQ